MCFAISYEKHLSFTPFQNIIDTIGGTNSIYLKVKKQLFSVDFDL